MSRRRWLWAGLIATAAAIVAICAGFGTLLWPRSPSTPTAAGPVVPRGSRPPPTRGGPDEPGVAGSDATHAVFAQTFERQLAALSTDCDLPLRAACFEDTCTALVVSPDLDRLSGWLRVAMERPRFVASAALRDLGVPPAALPCGQAIDAFTATSEVRAVELPDGTELWCMVQRAAGDPWAPESRASCGALAHRAVGTDRAAFDDPDLRRLEFDRDP